jgi:ubiquinone/menaquinone biosynthesis C-methylase UbiE
MASLPGGRSSLPDPRQDACAAREPYFSVVSDPKFLRAHLTPEHERKFYDGGDALVDAMFRVIELRLAPQFAPTAMLEYGCGAGRLAIPLARRAGRRAGTVTAVDRSVAQLDLTRREADRLGLSNLALQTPDELAASGATFDFVNCYFVFQRMARADGLDLLRYLAGRIRSGGIGAFQFPYRVTAPPLVRASRFLRHHVPGVNAAVNLARRRPAADPFMACHTYDLNAVARVVDEAGLDAVHLVFEPHEGLASAILLVEVPSSRASSRGDHLAATVPAAAPPDARQPQHDDVIAASAATAHTPIEELNRAAEQYFASITDPEFHLAKPFGNAEETPQLLIDAAMLVQGLRMAPGMTVLEFGAGSGWFSRILTQLGGHVILLDVSATALRLARELYVRLPVIGQRPEPRFLLFDGQHVALPDASVDRIVCLHAFHHAPNPDEVLAEFSRVLKPGGIAAFAEPGPHHSRSAQSQFERRTFGVVERDVDVHEIWRTACACGFREMRLAAFHGLPFHVSLAEYEDLLAGGSTGAKWVASTRVFLRNVRTFFLFRAGDTPTDSHSAEGLACQIHAAPSVVRGVDGQPAVVEITVTNSGSARWLGHEVVHGGVALGAHLYDRSGRLLDFDLYRGSLTVRARDIAPGETVSCRISLPPQAAGRYVVEFDCVSSRVMWFSQLGSLPARVDLDVAPA